MGRQFFPVSVFPLGNCICCPHNLKSSYKSIIRQTQPRGLPPLHEPGCQKGLAVNTIHFDSTTSADVNRQTDERSVFSGRGLPRQLKVHRYIIDASSRGSYLALTHSSKRSVSQEIHVTLVDGADVLVASPKPLEPSGFLVPPSALMLLLLWTKDSSG